MMTVRSAQWRASSKLSTSARVLDQLLDPGRGRVLLLAVLVVGDQEREQVVPDAPVDGLDARLRVRPDAGGDRHRPRREVDLLRIALPLAVRPRDREQLLGVRPRPLPELAREAGQAALVLHVQQELRRAVRVGGDDHLLGGVGVTVADARLAAPSRGDARAPRTRRRRAGRGRTPRGARGPRRRASPPGRGSSSSACSWRCGRSRCCTCRTRCSRCDAARPRRSTDRRPRRPGSRSRRRPGPC